MGLETSFNYIDDLNPANPNGDPDQVAQGDDHLRGIKNAVLGSFPNLGQAAVTATSAVLNETVAVRIPIGGIIMFNAAFSTIPANFQLCNGTNGTPDLTSSFVYGTNLESELLDSGGSADAVVVSHTHNGNTLSTGTESAHTHPVPTVTDGGILQPGIYWSTTAGAVGPTGTTSAGSPHSHSVSGSVSSTGVSATNANLPPYIKLAYIQRMT